jgi:hypothetical protein
MHELQRRGRIEQPAEPVRRQIEGACQRVEPPGPVAQRIEHAAAQRRQQDLALHEAGGQGEQRARPAPGDPVAPPARIAALVADADAAFTRFDQRRDTVAALVTAAAGRAIDSPPRARALTALSDLSSLRSATAVPLGDLDVLAAEAATTFAPTDRIDEARVAVRALVERQDAVLAELWAEMDR